MNLARVDWQKWLKTAGTHTVVIGVCLLCAGSNRRSDSAPKVVEGPYRLEFRGALTGSGNGTVNPAGVFITGLVRDEAGNTGPVVAPNLPLNKGRFSGTGTGPGGMPLQISGRVDFPGDTLKTARLVCTFETSRGRFGRAIGMKQ